MSLIKEYLELTKRFQIEYGEQTILLMQNGAFFEVYGLKDANDNIYGCKLGDFSRICDLNVVEKRVPGGEMRIDGDIVINAGFKTHLMDKYIKKLQDNGFTVVVYEEEGDDPIKKTKIRNQTGIYSPGTYFYPDPEPENITNNICSIWLEYKKGSLKNKYKNLIYIGTSVIDIYTGITHINEFVEEYIKNPTTFDDLERFLSIYNPSETIIISNMNETDTNDIISYVNLKSKSIHRVFTNTNTNNINIVRASNCEKQTYQTELLNKFYEINDIQSFMTLFYDNVYATQSYCYLLDFVYQHNPYLIKKIAIPTLDNNSKNMILANHSLKQLNIIDDDNYKGKYSSVSKMLNECITPMGKRQFVHNFLNPVTDEDYLMKEYNIIDTVIDDDYANNYSVIKYLLVKMKDISKIMRQIILQRVSPKLLYQLYQSILLSRDIYYSINNEGIKEYLKDKLPFYDEMMEKTERIIDYLNSVLYIEECRDIDSIGKIEKSFIKSGIDEELDKKINVLMESQDQLEACRSYFSSLISTYELSTKSKKTVKKKQDDKKQNDDDCEDDLKEYVSIYETEKNNFSLVATDRRCKILEEVTKNNGCVNLKYRSSYNGEINEFTLSLEIEYLKQSQSKKSITNKQINELCRNVSSIKVNLIGLVTKVYQSIIKSLHDYQDDIENITKFITYVDIIYCKAHVAIKYNYCKPIIEENQSTDKSYIIATDLRHSLIEKIQQTELYVGNDINIGTKNGLDGILLYGTNAVGKTSFIRSLGIALIMAQSGLYVPASTFKYKPYKYIFTRILGNDNLFKGLSTFAVEMSELRTILRLSDKNSLVLGDELCSGTESISAVSIFVAGIQKLASVNCSFIFATHLHEIISYDEIVSLHNVGMKHMSVIYDKENDCLVYDRKLKDGPGNNMYGLEVCKSLNLPDDFLENAHNIRMKYHPETGSILSQKVSHYNAKHLTGGLCEKCGINEAVDVHHMIYKNEADVKGVIKKNGLTFDKNSNANLLNLCQSCHDDIHKKKKVLKRTKTTKGMIIKEV